MGRRLGQLLAFFCALSGSAWAGEADTTALRGLAGAGMADGLELGSVRRAPAAMLLDVDYAAQVELGFGDGLRPMGVMKDTRTSNFGAGVLYTSEWADRAAEVDDLPGWLPADEELPTDDSWSQTTRVSMGYGAGQLIIPDGSSMREVRRFAVGVSAVYERVDSSLSGLTQAVELDVGLAGRPTGLITVAATAHDLLPTGERLPSAELGVCWLARPTLKVVADGAWDRSYEGQPWGGRAGLELTAAEAVPLRVGYAVEGDTQRLGLGLGIEDQKARLDYAINVMTVGPKATRDDPAFITHSVALRVQL